MVKSRVKARWSALLSVAVSGVILWLVLRDLDWAATVDVLQKGRWAYLPVAFGLWALSSAARAVRWRILMEKQMDLRGTFSILSIGILLNNTLPFRLGEIARAYLCGRYSKDRVSSWTVLSTIAVERIVDMLAVVLILSIAVAFLSIDEAVIMGGMLLGAAALISLLILVVYAHHPHWALRFLDLAEQRFMVIKSLHLEAWLKNLLNGLHTLTRWSSFMQIMLWTVGIWALSLLGMWALSLCIAGFEDTPHLAAVLLLAQACATFSIIVPITPAGVGPFEAAIIFAVGSVGVASKLAAAYAVLFHSVLILTYSILGVFGFLYLRISPTELNKGLASFKKTVALDGR